jgi:hypothetical protein
VGKSLLSAGGSGFGSDWLTAGVFEGFFGTTNRLPSSMWAGWEHPAIYLLLALLTILAGLIARSLAFVAAK